jgi:poly(A) polymerase
MIDLQNTQAVPVVQALRKAGHVAYLVGGCVRDMLLKKAPKDWDVVTTARPEEVEKIFSNTKPVGKAFGVILVVAENGELIEVATARSEEQYTDGRHPDKVVFSSIKDDIKRRDFTMNGLLYDPNTGHIVDYSGGQEDIKNKKLRTIGRPADRFKEDRLRIMRAVRFTSTLGFKADPETWAAIKDYAPQLSAISVERIREELLKILTGPNAEEGIRLLKESGILHVILPEVVRLVGVTQPPEFHPTEDAFEHTRLMFRHLEKPSPELAMAALLHDIGKAETRTVEDRIRFTGHAEAGAKMAEDILRRLKFSNQEIETIVDLVADHMRFKEVKKMRRSTLRKFLGRPNIEDHLKLHWADCHASNKIVENYDYCLEKLSEFKSEPVLPPPLVRGKDLIALGMTPGPEFKKILNETYMRQLEQKDPKKEELLASLTNKSPEM